MSRIIPLGSIPKTNLLPDDVYRLRTVKLEAGMTKEREGKTQKYQLHLTSQVVEPANLKGLFFHEYFTIGTDDDPDAEQLATWQTSFGGRSFARFVDKSGVPLGDEVNEDDLIAAFTAPNGAVDYLATIVMETETKEGPWKGRIRNKVTAYWALGEKQAGAGVSKANGQAGKVTTTTPTATGKVPPTDEVSCSSCKKRVPKAQLRAHVDAHMREAAEQLEAE